MNKEKVLKWLKASGIRACRTFFQTLAGYISGSVVILSDVNWAMAFSAALMAMIYSVIMALAGLPELNESEG